MSPATTSPDFHLRLALIEDVPDLERLIPLSVHALQAQHYGPEERAAALGPVFGVDRQLIRDGTYFVVEVAGQLVACGGWSRRKTLFGGDAGRDTKADENTALDPLSDAARIRAFFVHPDWVRQGLGRKLLDACENAALAYGFQRAELVATLAGEPLYRAGGYEEVRREEVPLGRGLKLPVVKMSKQLAHSLLVTDSNVL